jgi:hypothetical protein
MKFTLSINLLGTISIINNMIIPATTICNSNILDILNNKMNKNKQQLNMYSAHTYSRLRYTHVLKHQSTHSSVGSTEV